MRRISQDIHNEEFLLFTRYLHFCGIGDSNESWELMLEILLNSIIERPQMNWRSVFYDYWANRERDQNTKEIYLNERIVEKFFLVKRITNSTNVKMFLCLYRMIEENKNDIVLEIDNKVSKLIQIKNKGEDKMNEKTLALLTICRLEINDCIRIIGDDSNETGKYNENVNQVIQQLAQTLGMLDSILHYENSKDKTK